MSYEGGTQYSEEDFHGWRKSDVLTEETAAFLHNVEAAGVDSFAVVHALEEAIKQIKDKRN